MRTEKPISRSNSSMWRAWRQTSIKVFVGLNLLIIAGFYIATSSFHGGLSHLEQGAAMDDAETSGSGRTGKSAPLTMLTFCFSTGLSCLLACCSLLSTAGLLVAVQAPTRHIQLEWTVLKQ